MKCPKCGSKLKPIGYAKGEWICENPECPENKGSGSNAYAEFYGNTQKEINEDAI